MSNKQQLQTNNEKYASLIETLRGKAIPSGSEDLDTELTTQENLISQLSTILDSKASGGSGGDIETCTVTMNLAGYPYPAYMGYTTVENGSITYFNGTHADLTEFTVLKNSIFFMGAPDTFDWRNVLIASSGGVQYLGRFGLEENYTYAFIATSDGGFEIV